MVSKYVKKCICENCGYDEAYIDYVDRTIASLFYCPVCGEKVRTDEIGDTEVENKGFGLIDVKYTDRENLFTIHLKKNSNLSNEIEKILQQYDEIEYAYLNFKDEKNIYKGDFVELYKNGWKKINLIKDKKVIFKRNLLNEDSLVLRFDDKKEISLRDIKIGESFLLKEYENLMFTKVKKDEKFIIVTGILNL